VPFPEFNPEKALIFRITHKSNFPWILDNGLHCRNSEKQDPNFVNIGSADLIAKRRSQPIKVPPGGTLADYIPFYFTPLSMMAYNIHTGRGVQQRNNSEIIILVSSLRKLQKDGVSFLFTDRHASVNIPAPTFSSDLAKLEGIDWTILQNRDFVRDNDDLDKTNRYQAEALVHKSMAVDSLLGVACCDDEQKAWAESEVEKRKLNTKVVKQRGWYF
jgi:hypothetical protein